MKEYMKAKVLAHAKEHAKEEYPKEACGLVVKGEYKPYKNIASDPKKSFKIHHNAFIANDGKIDFVVHSHCDTHNDKDNGHPSKVDMQQQITTNVPWCLIHMNEHGNYRNHFCWGDQLEIQDLVGRPFSHGIYDCYSLMRDFFRVNGIVTLKIHPRNNHFWERYELPNGKMHEPEDIIMEGIQEVPYKVIDPSELKKGDGCFAKIKSDVVNHCAIYLGNGLVLHHLYGKLSRTEPINRWKDYWCMFARYTGEKGWCVK